MVTQRRFPKIIVDHEKCTVPFLCKKCLQVCPLAILHVERVLAAEERLKEVDPRIPRTYRIMGDPMNPIRRDKCTMCNKCVEVCPVGAIRIEAPQ